MTALLLPSLALLAGFVLLVWSADRFVDGASALARHWGVSPLIIGLTIVGFGTSAPELVVSAVAALQGNAGIAVGNAIGSNITNIGLVLGATAMISPFQIRSEIIRREYPILFLVMLATLALLSDGYLSRLDGAILIVALVIILIWLVRLGKRRSIQEPLAAEFAAEIPKMSRAIAIIWVVVGLILMIASSRLLVYGAVAIAEWLGVSDLIFGLTIVAIGTSLPELAASVMSVRKNEPDIAIGNVIGSNIFNLLGVLGIPGVISPLVIEHAVLQRDYPYMIGMTILLFALAYGFRGPARLRRIEGAILLSGFIAYLVILYFNVVHH
jgi:cation:H+ antiporter